MAFAAGAHRRLASPPWPYAADDQMEIAETKDLLEQKKLQLTKSKRHNQALYEKLTKYEMYMYSSP